MKRREFLRDATGLAASTVIASQGWGDDPVMGTLSQHRITDVVTQLVDTSWPRPVGRNAVKGNHGQYSKKPVVTLVTDQGASGWAQVRGSEKSADKIAAQVIGKQVSELFSPAQSIKANHLMPLELALHDLAGVILDMPVWKMISERPRDTPFVTRIYSGMIYFDDLDPPESPAGIEKLIEECLWDYDYGYRQFKVKIGRGHKWMSPASVGLQRDINVVQAIHERFPDCDILVDANNGYRVDDCIAFLSGIKGIPLFWFEEPFHENVADSMNGWTETVLKRPIWPMEKQSRTLRCLSNCKAKASLI